MSDVRVRFLNHVFVHVMRLHLEKQLSQSSKFSLIYVDVINIKEILNICILFKQPKIGLP
jgi:hypothetical protein